MNKEFLEYSKKRMDYLSDGYTVFQYQSFDYGDGVKNIGMSDPEYKWKNILKMDKFKLKGNTLLDIGCNIGCICSIAASKGAKATGIESDKNFFNAANFLDKYRKQSIFICNDFMSHQFNQQYDYVLALAVLYCFNNKYPYGEVIKKVRSLTKKVFVGELTYDEKKKPEVLDALHKYFSRVEFIGDSKRTNVNIKKLWKDREENVSTRQVWHCYV